MIRLPRAPFRRTGSAPSETLHLEGVKKRAIDTGRARLIVAGAIFLLAFSVIGGQMVNVTILRDGGVPRAAQAKTDEDTQMRADIVDRNGVLLATSLPMDSLYAHPKEIQDPATAAKAVAQVLPDLNAEELQGKFASDRGFVYLKRNLTPKQVYDVNALGIPGLYFEQDQKRVYPQGDLAAHVVGLTDLDGKGVAGVEKKFDKELDTRREPLRLALDVRVQTVLRDELAKTVADFNAIGATGMVMDIRTGELLGMVSLPDFDPNTMAGATPEAMFDRATLGVYEMGSVFKLFDAAACIDAGVATPTSTYDATHPIHVARFEIFDHDPQNRWLSVPEILIYSSNIGAAKMALDLGTDRQKDYLGRFGLLHSASVEVPEVGAPLVPNPWREINTMTIAYGHGMAVSPVQLVQGVSAIVDGGVLHPATLLARTPGEPVPGVQVIKPATSRAMLDIMRMIVTEGTGKKADVPGYEVGGKTGTAEKAGVGGYHHKLNLSSFIATFPVSNPRYVVLAMIDEPHGNKESYGFATAGFTAAPAVGRIVAQIGPMLGVQPIGSPDDGSKQRVAEAAAPKSAQSQSPVRKVSLAAVE
ncbi:MAG TPA: penicillin-binding protein 2 [Magnetospirillaceae bacterium]|jgi:cell division protein FtsI (penicillin-binding protein 3)